MMAEHDSRDPEDARDAGRLYRELPREDPPAHLDDAIRAAARRLGAAHPAPLVAPTGRRSWHYPMAAAAVIVLAVAVTWHVEREQPDRVAALPSAPAAADSAVLMKQRSARGEEEQRRSDVREQGGLAAAVERPERWLERIAQMRREGKHEEAEKALAEFRKRHPDYRISPETLEKVEIK